MHRLGCIVLCLVLVLTACSTSTVSPVTSGFRCQVSITYDDLSAQATLERSEQGVTVLSFLSPRELDGFALSYDGQAVTVSYRGIELPLGDQVLPTSAVRVIDDALACCTVAESTVEFNGECDGGRFTVTFDPQSGFPTELYIESLDLRVFFTEWETL